MPYVECPTCATRSYLAPRVRQEPCPVCGAALKAPERVAGWAATYRGEEGPTDRELAARHRRGEDRAFVELHERYAPELRAQARRAVGNFKAEDMVQEAFLRAHRLLLHDERVLLPEFALRAWLHTVLRNCCIDELRRPSVPVAADADPVVAATTPGPLELVVIHDELHALTAAVRALPRRQREALVRVVLRGESHEHVAQEMAVSVGATKSLVNRARVELRHSAAA